MAASFGRYIGFLQCIIVLMISKIVPLKCLCAITYIQTLYLYCQRVWLQRYDKIREWRPSWTPSLILKFPQPGFPGTFDMCFIICLCIFPEKISLLPICSTLNLLLLAYKQCGLYYRSLVGERANQAGGGRGTKDMKGIDVNMTNSAKAHTCVCVGGR